VRDYLIRLLPQVRRVRVPEDKVDRCAPVGTTPQSAVPCVSRLDCVSGSDASTPSTTPCKAHTGMRLRIVRSSGHHSTACALIIRTSNTHPALEPVGASESEARG
jgi:hypothetical protein